jgi:quercetin dioxygenase-like cupin family protein
VLFVTEGSGLVQSRGGPVESIAAGDSVCTAPGEWHWHGAAPTTAMSHTAVQEAGPDGTTTT